MVPTFLQKRRSHSLRVGLTLSIVVLVIGYTVAIALIIAERSFSRGGKLLLIGGALFSALLLLGFVERLRR
jgi:hypothetical protein